MARRYACYVTSICATVHSTATQPSGWRSCLFGQDSAGPFPAHEGSDEQAPQEDQRRGIGKWTAHQAREMTRPSLRARLRPRAATSERGPRSEVTLVSIACAPM
jgi:hypothetical protein